MKIFNILKVLAVGFVVIWILIVVLWSVFFVDEEEKMTYDVSYDYTLDQAMQLVRALDEYKSDNGKLPEEYVVFDLLHPEYITPLPTDYWGLDFKYKLTPTEAHIISRGKDGVWDTVDDIKAVYTTNQPPKQENINLDNLDKPLVEE